MFTPKYLKDRSLDLSSIFEQLDAKFKQEVDSGWFELWYKDRIFLVLSVDSLGANVVLHREKIEEYYKSLGWKNAKVATSEEGGELAGLVMLTLYL